MLVVVAATNLRAAHREHRASRLASDLVAATVIVTADATTEQPGAVVLTISVSNNGPVLQLRSPRVEAPGYRLEPIGGLSHRVATGETVLLTVRLRGACRPTGDTQPRVVTGVIPPSGRLHEVRAGVSPDLAALLCIVPAAAIEPQVTSVRGTAAAVDFGLRLRNRSTRPILLRGLAGEGLRLSVHAGLPTTLPPGVTTLLAVRLAVASCAGLPEPLDAQRTDTLPFGALELEVSGASGATESVPFLTGKGSALYAGMRTLARASCPHALL